MARVADAVFGKDVDDLLSYNTPKLVRIRDRRLCVARILLSVAILLYVILYAVVDQQGYLKAEPPVGAVRLAVRAPANGSAAAAYCNAAAPAGPFVPAASPRAAGPQQLPCLNWTEAEAVYPEAEEWSTFLATRVGITAERAAGDCIYDFRACGSPAFAIDAQGNTLEQRQHYVLGVEDYTLMVHHSVVGITTRVEVRERDMRKAQLLDSTGQVVKQFNFADALGNGPARAGDLLTVRELLDAAGLRLDAASVSEPGQLNRYTGVVLLLYLDYEARRSAINQLQYKMRVLWLRGLEYQFEQVLYSRLQQSTPGTERLRLDRHGIRVMVVMGGKLGRFSFLELMKSIVTGFALFSIAKFVVDRILLRLLPLARVYRNYKYVDSVDFSEVEPVPAASAADDERYTVRNPDTGDKYVLEAHDFVYGTLLRGGPSHAPRWDIGAGPVAAHARAAAAAGKGGDPGHGDAAAAAGAYGVVGGGGYDYAYDGYSKDADGFTAGGGGGWDGGGYYDSAADPPEGVRPYKQVRFDVDEPAARYRV